MDIGAPMPHVITNGGKTIVVFHAGLPADPAWDGTDVTIIRPSSQQSYDLAWVKFEGVAATLLGPPNDEAISGHPLWTAGLEPYCFHIVENSTWRSDYTSRNRVHPHHNAERWNRLNHYLITFHDETFECLATNHTSGATRSTLRTKLNELIDDLLG